MRGPRRHSTIGPRQRRARSTRPDRGGAAWVAFARTGNPNTPGLPKSPAYSTRARETMSFNNASRVEQDPDREPRLVMEQLLKLTYPLIARDTRRDPLSTAARA